MASIPKVLREAVIARAKGYCEYCQTAQQIVIDLEVDHIIPQSAGGMTTFENLCLACAKCNAHKGSAQTAFDFETGLVVLLYDPRRQMWRDHFRWSDDGTRLNGQTPVGRATIDRLKINRDAIVQARIIWVLMGLHPPPVPD